MNKIKAITFAMISIPFALVLAIQEEAPEKPAPTTAEQCVDGNYSMARGVSYTAEQLVKRNLNDPSSFDLIESYFVDTRVVVTYRAKNGFGGIVKATTVAVVEYINDNCVVTLVQ